MTSPLDEKGLNAAIDVACRNAGHDPNACMFGSGGTGVGHECHVTYREAHRAGTAQVIRAYLSTASAPDELEAKLRHQHETVGVTPELRAAYEAYKRALPDELEVAAWELDYPDGSGGLCFTEDDIEEALSDMRGDPDAVKREALVLRSQAQAKLEIAERNRDAARDNFHTMQQAADKLRVRAETAEAEVKRLTEEKEALSAAIVEIADFDPDGPIDPDTVRLIRIAGAARRAILTQENADGQ